MARTVLGVWFTMARMITEEVLLKLRNDRTQLLGSAQTLSAKSRGSDIHGNATHLESRLRTYVGLVDAVLDACSLEEDDGGS